MASVAQSVNVSCVLSASNAVCAASASKAAAKPAAFKAPVSGNVKLAKAFMGAPLAMKHSSNSSRKCAAVQAMAADPFKEDYEGMAKAMADSNPLDIMDKALTLFGDRIAIAFSGAEDVALIEYAKMTRKPFRVFSLDTGRLNPETYRFFDTVEKHYKIKIEYTFPDAEETMKLVREKGMFSFYTDGHEECCRVRKVRPLRRQLKTLDAWITGQRKDQSPGTRTQIPVVQVDPVFEGTKGGPGSLIKFNPLANISSADVWSFLRIMEVPINELHAKGYISIGCEPCTKAVLPNQHEREGRWWWEDATQKECGLHKGNLAAGAGASAAAASATADVVKGAQTIKP
eukprot:jgi/Mesvir1/15813/Mv03369-RA.1